MNNDELKYCLALALCPGIGSIHYQTIKAKYPSFKELFNYSHQSLKKLGFNEKICTQLHKTNWKEIDTLLKWQSESNEHHIIELSSPNYPKQLKQIPDAPPILYIKGLPQVLHNKQISIIGSRKPSGQGIENTQLFTHQLSMLGLTVTSGLAYGIDVCAHKTCVENNAPTIAVLGSGLEHIYPRPHKNLSEKIQVNGALVSEFTPFSKPVAQNFPRRNRIISGLSLGTLVIEAGIKSGTLITAQFALEHNREVFAVPGSIHNKMSAGCHYLIKQGAVLVDKAQDILSELSIAPASTEDAIKKSHQIITSEDNHELLLYIDDTATPIDVIIKRCNLPVNKLNSLLLELELQGLITAGPGGYQKTGRHILRGF